MKKMIFLHPCLYKLILLSVFAKILRKYNGSEHDFVFLRFLNICFERNILTFHEIHLFAYWDLDD